MHTETTDCAVMEADREKRCISCGEYWPADEEFFMASRQRRDGLSQRCHACIKEGLWTYVRQVSSS